MFLCLKNECMALVASCRPSKLSKIKLSDLPITIQQRENHLKAKENYMRRSRLHLEQLVLQSHVILRLKSNASLEDVDQGTSLLRKSIDDRSARRSQGCLEHEAENAEHAVEVLEVLGGSTVAGMRLPLDASHHLCDDDQINDQGGSKKRVLADIEDAITD